MWYIVLTLLFAHLNLPTYQLASHLQAPHCITPLPLQFLRVTFELVFSQSHWQTTSNLITSFSCNPIGLIFISWGLPDSEHSVLLTVTGIVSSSFSGVILQFLFGSTEHSWSTVTRKLFGASWLILTSFTDSYNITTIKLIFVNAFVIWLKYLIFQSCSMNFK